MERRAGTWYYYVMKNALNIFFVTLGVIFFILILIGLYVYFADPFNLKPLLFDGGGGGAPSASESAGDRNPALSPSQEAALDSIGVDPASVPSSITPEQEECFVEVLGAARVEEIKSGDTPTAIEFFRARECLE